MIDKKAIGEYVSKLDWSLDRVCRGVDTSGSPFVVFADAQMFQAFSEMEGKVYDEYLEDVFCK